MSASAEKHNRFHYVDGVRGIAAIMVVISHAMSSNIHRFLLNLQLPGILNKLWHMPMHLPGKIVTVNEFVAISFWSFTASALDLFFVVSGMVLLRPFLRRERDFDSMRYFKKRFTRIFPTYWVALALGAAVIWFINTYPTWYNEKGIYVEFSLWETLKQAAIVNTNGIYYNLAWWSIQIELVFYVCAPILIFIFPKGDKINNTRLTLMVIGTFLFGLGLQIFFDAYVSNLYSFDHVFLKVGRFVNYPICFLMGMLLATRDFSVRQAYVFMGVGLFVYLFHWYYLPVLNTACGLFYGGVLMLAYNKISFQKWLSKPVFVWVGERSYSIFLVHLSVFYLTDNLAAYFTTHRGWQYALLTRGLGIPFAFLVAILLFNTVEKRFVRGMVTDKMLWPWQGSRMKRD